MNCSRWLSFLMLKMILGFQIAGWSTSILVNSVDQLLNAVNNGQAGDKIQIAPGTYLLPSPLRPRSNMVIQGAGIGKTILSHSTSWNPGTSTLPEGGVDPNAVNKNAYLLSLANNTTNLLISDITFRGPQLHGALYGYNCDGLQIKNCRFENFLWSSIRTFAMDYAIISGNEFIDAGGTYNGIAGGALYLTWTKDSRITDNYFAKSGNINRNWFGIKGREAQRCKIEYNTILVDFSIELPFEKDQEVEIKHNYLIGTVSVPKYGGGPLPSSGITFQISYNYFRKSYALEWPRNGTFIHHNLFEFSTNDDGGNLISGFAKEAAPGPTEMYNNLILNPGRGIFWCEGVFNNFRFYHNHVIANRTVTPRTGGLFGFNINSIFSTIEIRNNIIECIGLDRPLVRNSTSYTAIIENNQLIGVSDTAYYSNPQTGLIQGLFEPLYFYCGRYGEYQVKQWNCIPVSDARSYPTTEKLLPVADTYVRGGKYANINYGTSTELCIKNSPSLDYKRITFLRFDLANRRTIQQATLKVYVTKRQDSTNKSVPIILLQVPTQFWEEASLTWKNMPSFGSSIATTICTKKGETLHFDVTTEVQKVCQQDVPLLSVALWDNQSTDYAISLGSRESSFSPTLEIQQ